MNKMPELEHACYVLTDALRDRAEDKCQANDIYAVHFLVSEMIKIGNLPRRIKNRLGE